MRHEKINGTEKAVQKEKQWDRKSSVMTPKLHENTLETPIVSKSDRRDTKSNGIRNLWTSSLDPKLQRHQLFESKHRNRKPFRGSMREKGVLRLSIRKLVVVFDCFPRTAVTRRRYPNETDPTKEKQKVVVCLESSGFFNPFSVQQF